jgi:polyisoprenoid-binding protein YceI
MLVLRCMVGCLAAVLTAGSVAYPADSTITRAIDVTRSTAQFSVQHVFVDRVTGTVPIQSGVVVLPTNSLVPLSANAVLDATHINTGDRDQTSALRGSDFFDTQHFPTWTFTSTKVTAEGDSAFAMDGLLTIHGVTQPEHLEVAIRAQGTNPEYRANVYIDRHAFGMKIVPLDPAIGNPVEVTLDIYLK